MVRAVSAAAGIALIGVAVAGCGHADRPTAAPTTTTAGPIAPSPNTIGLCGGVSDSDVEQATGVQGLQRVAINPFSCSWQPGADGDYTVIFHWFRGAGLDARRDQITDSTPATVTVAGRSGLSWTSAQSCEVGVPFGGTDFIDWSIKAGTAGNGRPQPCSALEQLAAETLTKAGQG